MTKKMQNKNLTQAKKNKKDEFYTQLSDIERELKHYKKHFRDKVVYCNCDDPHISNFFHYFSTISLDKSFLSSSSKYSFSIFAKISFSSFSVKSFIDGNFLRSFPSR
jgi:hypothetical protein